MGTQGMHGKSAWEICMSKEQHEDSTPTKGYTTYIHGGRDIQSRRRLLMRRRLPMRQ